ncbi:MAG: TonB-dependent receptor [Aureispira sp.]|nr:TonB-dependent receptor [Aureispira sp.]
MLLAQTLLSGRIIDIESDEGISGVPVMVQGTSLHAITDMDGYFELEVEGLPLTLVCNHIAYETIEQEITTDEKIEIKLKLKEIALPVMVVGSRFAPRTSITSAVPIDNITYTELLSTGQQTLDKMMMYSIPSFNSTQQTISDATAHFDPMDLRGLGPSRTLVLINGKRKNPSALVYINDTPGKGEVGVDMKSIPAAAIERIEVLRDGASAQYGSDAIAGVINVILKKDYDITSANLYSGITLKGDGFHVGANANTGFRIGKEGYLSATVNFYRQNESQRAGTPGEDNLFGVSKDDSVWGDWLADNPNLGTRVGQPELTQGNVVLNFKTPVTKWLDIYSFGGFTYRRTKSYALYRTPYWIPDPHNLLHKEGTYYRGFQPTFESTIFDHNFTLGAGGGTGKWKYDLSVTSGSNHVKYAVNNTINTSMGANSPTSFNPGGYEFLNVIANADAARELGPVTIMAGVEYRTEMFAAKAGDTASYFGSGAQSFPGIQDQNAVGFGDANRYNIGGYLEVVGEFLKNKNLLIGAAGRLENYSDFGLNFSWKGNVRYKFLKDRMAIRGSASTGFRAPSLHQSYLSIIQTLISGGTVSNQGTFNNQHPAVNALGVPKLKQETALNFTAGIAANPMKKMFVSLDFYRIAVKDRIVYSSSVASSDPSTIVGQIMNDYSITSLKFFTNAANTVSQGLDFVFQYKGLKLGQKGGALSFAFSMNMNQTKIDTAITTPEAVSAAGVDIFDRKEQSRIVSARPLSKMILSLIYQWKGLRVQINNTRFGAVRWQHATNPDFDQTFRPKILTDLQLQYQVNPNFFFGVYVNNILNVYPDPIETHGDVVTDLGGRFLYPWEVNQFGFNGTNFSVYLGVRFGKNK